MITVIAATVALAAPSREALIERWLHANKTHSLNVILSAASGVEGRSRSVILSREPALSGVEGKDDVAKTLRTLADREFSVPGRYQLTAPTTAAPTEPWWLRVWDWFAQRWQKFWNAIFSRVHVGREQAASIGDVLLVAIGLLLIFVVIRLLINLQFARSRAGATAKPLAESPTPRALYKQACSAASRGDYGTAALLLFAATVALLDRRGTVRVTSSATVGDLRREVRTHSAEMLAPFDAVAAPFVQRAYAERSIDAPQWEDARSAFVALSGEG